MVAGNQRALIAAFAATVLVIYSASNATSIAGISDSKIYVAKDTSDHGISGKIRGPLFEFLNRLPFAAKINGRIGAYSIGFWPSERGRVTSLAYGNPGGFIEVTQDNQNTAVSEHFRLGDFMTHDQGDVWPKYVVLREPLLDKLELVIDELEKAGVVVRRMTVMSGFRTPRYNGPGGDGRSGVSRHMYGDAADVFVDNDGNGLMDDLNRDGRVDYRDARVILAAAERVEQRHPKLRGGVGVYRATAGHGPFAHIDVRGWRARWGLIG
ncbi:MAG TPA: hypothetical protein VKH19_11300 [Gemmatimonadaceae bacterium]|nr:hypothetical protein [Gemmatimonadaceae bacterium]